MVEQGDKAGVNISCVFGVLLCLGHVSGSFPGGSDSKVSTCNAWDLCSIPGLKRSPGERNGTPLQYSCLENIWTEKPGGLQSMGSQWIRHDWVTNTGHVPRIRILYTTRELHGFNLLPTLKRVAYTHFLRFLDVGKKEEWEVKKWDQIHYNCHN